MAEGAIDSGAGEGAPVDSGEGTPPPTDGAAPVEGNDAPAEGASIVDSAGDDAGAAAPPPSVWPEDWRAQLAGEDEKTANVLNRFSSPEAMAKALVDFRTKLSTGELRRPLPEGASEEEVNAWRAEQGIPDEPGAYDIDLDGRVLPEGDDEIVQGFLEAAHGANFPPAMVNTALRWYADLAESEAASQIEADTAYKTENVEALRMEWPGGEYLRNINAVKSLLGDDLGGLILSARGADGNVLGNNADVIKAFAQWARELNPASTLSLPGTQDLSGITTEIEKIEAEMRKGEGGDYYSGEKDANGETKMMIRYRELLSAKEKMDAR